MEGIVAARLGKFVACLAGSGRMIQIAPQIRILVAVEAIDGRKGIDAIAQLCREKLNADPFSGYLFIFRTRRGTAISSFAVRRPRVSGWRPNGYPRVVFGGGPQARSLRERCECIRRNYCSRPAILTRKRHRHGVPCIPEKTLPGIKKTLAFRFRLWHTDRRWLPSGDIEGEWLQPTMSL